MDAARTMVLTRVIAAPVEVVWQAWTSPEALQRWWGPEGFTCETSHIDLREGGEWVFDMIGPEGTVYPNRHRIRVYAPQERIVYTLDDPTVDRPHAEVEVMFAPVEGGTRVTLAMEFATEAEYQAAKGFGAEKLGYQTLGKLARFVGAGP
ncbi:MAG: hypothetical protein EP318_09720 [Rhodobacteraceae bacterium]|nr:MAG: hypothetical protein EP318_09720 [Paracoccaceae bacterium]